MRKFNKINEAEAQVAQAKPETEGKGLVDINKGPEEVLKALIPNFAPAAPGEEKVYELPEELRKKLLAGREDGQTDDEKVTLTETTVKAGSLIPTQANIDIDKSLADQIYHLYGNLEVALNGSVPLSPEAPEKGMVKSKPGQFPILTFKNKFIIDGHHRWAARKKYAGTKKIRALVVHKKAMDVLGIAAAEGQPREAF